MPDVRIENESKKLLGKKKPSGAPVLGGAVGALIGQGGAYDALFGAKNTAGSLAEAIEKQAAAQKHQAEAKALAANPALANPFQALQDQLFGAANSINVAPTPIEQLRQLAQSQINAQFDPQIQALVGEMGAHSNRADRSMKQARQMYGALSKDYLSQLPEITNQYAQEDAATNQRYDQAQQQLAADYNKNANDQQALMQQLGIQAAAPDATQQAKDDQAYFQQQMELGQQSALDQLASQQNAQEDYQRNLGSNASMAGENVAQDIGNQLRDYMDQAGAQQRALYSQKGQAMAALLAQLQQQDAQRVQTQRQQEFDNMMKMFQFQLSAQNSAMDASKLSQQNSGFGAPGTLTTGLPGATNYLASQYPDQPILASNLMTILKDTLAQPDVKNGKFVLDPGDPAMGKSPKYSDVGQQYIEDLLRHQFEQQGGNRYSTGDINATLAALQAYLGKLR